MDPNATVQELALALKRGDDREARAYALDLVGWLGGGGFVPAGFTRAECDALIAQAIDPYGDVRDGVR